MITTLVAAALAAATPAAPAAPVDHSQHTPAQHAQHQKGEGEHKCCKEVNGKMECRMMKGHGSGKDGHGDHRQQQH